MYNFDEHNRMVSNWNNNIEVSRPDANGNTYYDHYELDRHNREVKNWRDRQEVRIGCIDD
jgi:hypothetical protein